MKAGVWKNVAMVFTVIVLFWGSAVLPPASVTWSAKPVAPPASKQEPRSSASQEGLPPLLDAEETAAVQAQLAQTGRGTTLYGALLDAGGGVRIGTHHEQCR